MTIKYTSERTFEFVGTDIECIDLDELSKALTKYQKKHPGEVFELYASVKCVPETSDNIISAIRATGVTLKHYWAPVSVDIQATPGKYGAGHVDIIDRFYSERLNVANQRVDLTR